MTYKWDHRMGNNQLGLKYVSNGTICLFLCFAGVIAQGDRPVCDIPPVEIQATAFVTCYLPETVVRNRSDFEVWHLRNVSNPVRVMEATWIKDKYAMNLNPGYVHDGSKDERRIFTFQIPRVDDSHAGTYSCRPAGYDDVDTKTCELVFKQNGSGTPATRESIATEASTSDHRYIINIVFLCVNIAFTSVLAVVLAKCPEKLISFRNRLKQLFCSDKTGNAESEEGIPMAPDGPSNSSSENNNVSPESR